MSLLEENVHDWIVNETNGLIEGRLKSLPDISAISRLTQGSKNKKIWKFVTKHVRSKQSVAFTRKILLLRQAEKEREKYPGADSTNHVILRNQVDNAEDKVRFVEHSTKSIIKHISSLKTFVKNKKEENCIFRQRCSIFETATLNLKEKNESLNVIIDQLHALLRKSFANEKTKCFKNLDQKSSRNVISKMSQNFKFRDDYLNNIINEMILIVKHRLLAENVNIPITNLVVPLTGIMSFTPSKDLVNQLKHVSQKDLDLLQNNIEEAKHKGVERLSEKYLQSMKQDLVDSCFQRKLHHTRCLLNINDVHFNEDIEKLQQDYIVLYIQNACLADSNDYLEKKITDEQSITENLKENNVKEKSQCQDIEKVMRDFHKTFQALHFLSNLLPQTFSSIQFSLESCRAFINFQVLNPNKCDKDNHFIDVVNKIDRDYELTLQLLGSREFLQDFLKDFTFTKLNFPAEVWEFLSIKPFQNPHLLIEKLSGIKAKLSVEPHHFCYEPDEISKPIAKRITSTVEENTDNLEVVHKNLFQVKKNCKNLDIVINDWWYQNAQYIPAIEYHGKTLKMWLAILKVLDDTEC